MITNYVETIVKSEPEISVAGLLGQATERTAELLRTLHDDEHDPGRWVRWCASVESLPLWDPMLIARVRRLTAWSLTEAYVPRAGAKDVKMVFKLISRDLRRDYQLDAGA